MTREEEIIADFESAANHRCNDNEKSLIISAMEWADEHPRKGFVDIEFVLKYFETIMFSWGVDNHNIQLALGNFIYALKNEE